jgi:hypothetical protein
MLNKERRNNKLYISEYIAKKIAQSNELENKLENKSENNLFGYKLNNDKNDCWYNSYSYVKLMRNIGIPCKFILNTGIAEIYTSSSVLNNLIMQIDDTYLNASIWNYNCWNEIYIDNKWYVIIPSKQRYLTWLELSNPNIYKYKSYGPIEVEAIRTKINENMVLFNEFKSGSENYLSDVIEIVDDIIENDGNKLWLKKMDSDVGYISAQIYHIYIRALTTQTNNIDFSVKDAKSASYELKSDKLEKLYNHYF